MIGNQQPSASPDPVDLETVKYLTETSAKVAAQEVAKTLREDLQDAFVKLEANLTTKIENEFHLRFGEMKPSEHIVAHSRLATFLDLADTTKKEAWKGFIGSTVKWMFGAMLLGAFVYLVGSPR